MLLCMPAVISGGAVLPPQILSTIDSQFPAATTSHAVSMPATVANGDLLVCHFGTGGQTESGVTTTPAGWTQLVAVNAASFCNGGIYYRVADGTEGGTTVNFVTALGVRAAARVWRIQAGTYNAAAIFGGSTVTQLAHAPVLTTEIPIPTGAGSYIAFTGVCSGGLRTVTDYPDGYVGGYAFNSDPGSTDESQQAFIYGCLKELTVDEIVPGTFTLSGVSGSRQHSATWAVGTSATVPLDAPVRLDYSGVLFNTNATAHLVPMPATVNNGDLLVVLFCSDGTATVTTPSGWSQIFTQQMGTTEARMSAFYRVANGTEGGTSVDFVTSASESGSAQVHRFQAGTFDPATPPEVGSLALDAVGTNVTAAGATVSPSWGAADNGYLAFIGKDNIIGVQPAGQYTGYSGELRTSNGATNSGRTGIISAYMGYRSGEAWLAQFSGGSPGIDSQTCSGTIAIRPAP